MALHKDNRVRLSVDCTNKERKYIKMLAAKNNMTISEYLLSFARREMPHFAQDHEPNEKTIKAIQEAEEGSGEVFESIDEFWDAMGVNPRVED